MSLRKIMFGCFCGLVLLLVLVAGVLTSPELKAACLSSAVTAGTSARASQYNNLRQDFYTGKFFDSACAGSNYLQVLHNGTDGVIQTNTGKIRVSPPTGSTIDLEVNGTDVLVVGGAGITASQYIAGASNMGLTGSLEVDGTSKLDGILNVAGVATFSGAVTASSTLGVAGNTHHTGTLYNGGAATFASTLTASGALGTSSTFHAGGAAHVAGALTVTGATTGQGLATFNSGLKPSSGSDTLDNYDYDTSYSDISLTLGGGTVNGFSITSANYAKIGRLVYFRYLISWTSITTPSGAFTITNCLPVATASTNANHVFGVVANNVDMNASGKFFAVRSSGTSSRDCIVSEVYDDGSNVTMTASAFDGNVGLIVSGFYVAGS